MGAYNNQRTFQSFLKNFYWPNCIIEVREKLMEGELCQQKRGVQCLLARLVEPLRLPKQNCANVNEDFIIVLQNLMEDTMGSS